MTTTSVAHHQTHAFGEREEEDEEDEEDEQEEELTLVEHQVHKDHLHHRSRMPAVDSLSKSLPFIPKQLTPRSTSP